ncbi:MAG: sigma-54-dependent transcriptional regulator [Polyangiaceae bacterium]
MERHVLVIDEHTCGEELGGALQRRGFGVTVAACAVEAVRLFESRDFGAALANLDMSPMCGAAVCRELVERRDDVPVIVTTAHANLETAIAAIRAGAYDFVTKPFDVEELALTLDRALRHRALREEVKVLRKAVGGATRFSDILGNSPAVRQMCDLVSRVAETDASVLVTGESGTGKELIARALHLRSARHAGPFVAINCAAMPENLLESELFGHVRGAFTDARTARQGLFVKATGGTLLLDEIGEMPAGMQAKLLRALQERTVRPVGGDEETPFDVRIIAATNRDLENEVAEHHFREDLFYRIHVVRIHVPPLRAREGDVLLLAQSFLERYALQSRRPVVGITSGAAEKLSSYAWPGNVRELQNCIERAVALAPLDHVSEGDLPEKIRAHKPARIEINSSDPGDFLPMDEVERRYIARVLDAVGGNKTLAAQVLGFDRRTLYRKLERERGNVPSMRERLPSGDRLSGVGGMARDDVEELRELRKTGGPR